MKSPETTPVISDVLTDGTLVEAIFDPASMTTALAIGRPDGDRSVRPDFTTPEGEKLVPYAASNNLLTTGCVLLPSDVGDVGDKGELLSDIRAFLARYVDLSPEFLTTAPYYVLLSWVFDRFEELPLIRLRGDFGTGKTRALLTLGSLCYKPFFASGASTVSPIFHILDAFRGTLILDEADFRFSDMTGELVKILNNGTVNGLPVLRTMPNRHRELNPRAFRVFGPKIIAMRESFQDAALESRLVTEDMGRRPLSPHIPIHTPRRLHDEARDIRNRLLAWRLANWRDIAPSGDRIIKGASPRTNQMALSLLSLVDDPDELLVLARWLGQQGDDVDLASRYAPERLMLTVMADAFDEATRSYVSVAEIATRYNARTRITGSPPMSNKWVGGIIRRLGLPTAKTNGTYGISIVERSRIRALADRLGLPRNPTTDEDIPSPDAAATETHVSNGSR